MMWAMWSMEERKKRIREWEGQREEGWDKRRGGKIEISKKSEIDSNQQCLQHTHAEASGTGRPQAPSGALTVTDASSPQATPASQANKHGDGQVCRWEFKPEFPGFKFSPQQDREVGSRSVDKRSTERLRVRPACALPASWAQACGGGLTPEGSPKRRRCQEALPSHCS